MEKMKPEDHLSITHHRGYRLATQFYLQPLIYRLMFRLISALKPPSDGGPLQSAGPQVEDLELLLEQLNPDGALLPFGPTYSVQHA